MHGPVVILARLCNLCSGMLTGRGPFSVCRGVTAWSLQIRHCKTSSGCDVRLPGLRCPITGLLEQVLSGRCRCVLKSIISRTMLPSGMFRTIIVAVIGVIFYCVLQHSALAVTQETFSVRPPMAHKLSSITIPPSKKHTATVIFIHVDMFFCASARNRLTLHYLPRD